MSRGKYIDAPVGCLIVNVIIITKAHCTQLGSIYFCSLDRIPGGKLNKNDRGRATGLLNLKCERTTVYYARLRKMPRLFR